MVQTSGRDFGMYTSDAEWCYHDQPCIWYYIWSESIRYCYVLTNGGPGHATEVLTTYAFQLYSRGQYGMSSALNTVLLVITAIIGVFIVKTLSKQEVQQ